MCSAEPGGNARALKYSVIPAYVNRRIGYLPQGAPSSPMLSNLAVMDLDEELASVAERFGMVYTRYSDDIVFSTDAESFSRQTARQLIGESYQALRRAGLEPNTTKTTVVPPGARKVVLGLTVDTERPRIPRRRREDIETHVYAIRKFGPRAHMRHRGFNSVLGLRAYIEGTIAWVKGVEPKFGDDLEQELSHVEWPL